MLSENPSLPVPAVVLGLSPTGLYAVRELGQAGIPVLGVSSYLQAGNHSRYLTHSLGTIVEADENHRLERLVDVFSSSDQRPVLIPASDQDIDFVLTHAQVLSEHFVFQPSYLDGIGERILSKTTFCDLCRMHGVEIPRSWQSRSSQLAELKGQISFPCLVKPSQIHEVKGAMGGEKGWVAADNTEFDGITARLPQGNTDWLVQEIIPGPESEITLFAAYFDLDSKPRQKFTARKLRQYPPGFGSASLVASHDEEDTRRLSEQFLTGIGYRGIAATEFKRDPRDGKLKIIEINPRPSLWFGLSTASGKSVTLAAYHDLAKTGIELEELQQRQSVGWRYALKDAYSSLFYRLKRDFVLPAPDTRQFGKLAPCVDAVWDGADPKPALGDLWNFGKKAVHRVIGGGAAVAQR